MRLNASARMHVVHKEEKESRLKQFLELDLAGQKATGARSTGRGYYLLARSWESPAARALAARADEAAALGIEIRALLMHADCASPGSDGAGKDVPAAHCRLIYDTRLRDAHELLILGDRAAWIGDCMRRDPSRRDAFECYYDGTVATARWAIRSFELLWTGADPSATESIRPAGAPGHNFVDASMIAAAENHPILATVRH